ncbi:MAG: efflux RND transporter periplasmic adaptor subunit [Bacteroidota bacterium]
MVQRQTPVIFLSFLLIVCVLFSCKGKPKVVKPKETPPPIVDIIIATPQPVTNAIEANGTVLANEYVELHPEVSGRLIFLNVKEGDHVTKGSVIARINDADLEAQLQKSKVQLDLAQKTEERLKKLLDVNGINQSDYDAAVNTAQGLQADMAYTQTLIDKTIIRAPFSGVVGLRKVSPGAFVTSADIIASIQQLDKIKIDFTIPEQYGNLIKKGGTVDVEIDAANQVKKKATIIATEPQVNQNSRNLLVRTILQNGVANPGAFVKVYVQSGVDKKAIMIPTNSIIPDDKNNQVVLVKNGKAAFVSVQTGLRLANNVEITKGINVGDSVVVTGVLFVRSKNPVNVRSVKKLEELGK